MTKSIFLIDNDLDDRELFCEALLDAAPHLNCVTASNGRLGLQKLQAGEIAFPDLIFLDVNMPVMNGWKCLAALREDELFRNIPVIMCSTSREPEDIAKAREMGALCFFSKPADFDELKKNLKLVVRSLTHDTLTSLIEESSYFQ